MNCGGLEPRAPRTPCAAAEDDLPNPEQQAGRPGHGDIMAWAFLILAGLLEVVWSFAMKQSEGFTRLAPTIVMLVAMIASVGLLTLAMRNLPLGTAYMVWTGIGAVGAFVAGVWLLGEPLTVQRGIAALLIVAGLVVMRFSE